MEVDSACRALTEKPFHPTIAEAERVQTADFTYSICTKSEDTCCIGQLLFACFFIRKKKLSREPLGPTFPMFTRWEAWSARIQSQSNSYMFSNQYNVYLTRAYICTWGLKNFNSSFFLHILSQTSVYFIVKHQLIVVIYCEVGGGGKGSVCLHAISSPIHIILVLPGLFTHINGVRNL